MENSGDRYTKKILQKKSSRHSQRRHSLAAVLCTDCMGFISAGVCLCRPAGITYELHARMEKKNMGSSESELSQDVVFDILSSPRRRYVLYFLRTTDEPVKLTDLAEQVAAWENDTIPENITEQQRKRVYVSLYQTHIPRLDEAGIIEYDKESGNIALSDDAVDIDDYLGSKEEPLPWQQIYLAIAAVSAVLLIAVAANIPVLGAIPETVAAAIVILAFVASATAHSVIRIREKQSVPSELQNKK